MTDQPQANEHALKSTYRRMVRIGASVNEYDRIESRRGLAGMLLRTSRFLALLYREIIANNMLQRAAALTYTTILSLFPLVMLVTSVASVFYTQTQEDQLVRFIEDRLMPPTSAGLLTPVEASEISEREQQVAELTRTVRGMSDRYRERAGGIGVAGFVGLLLTAALLFRSIDNAFEATWETGKAQSITRTITGFTSFLVLTPVLIWLSIAVSSYVVVVVSGEPPPGRIVAYADKEVPVEPIDFVGPPAPGQEVASKLPTHGPLTQIEAKPRTADTALDDPEWTLARVLLGLVTPLFNSLMLAVAYSLMPRQRVRLVWALLGGLMAGVLWELAKVAFFYYLYTSATNRALLSSLGAVPVFLIWIYFTWCVFLLGNELTHLFQNYERIARRFSPTRPMTLDGRLLAAIVLLIADAYERGESGLRAHDLYRLLRLPHEEIERMLAYLETRNVLVKTDAGVYVPAQPDDRMAISDIIALGGDPARLLTESGREIDSVRETLRRLSTRAAQGLDGESVQGLLVGKG